MDSDAISATIGAAASPAAAEAAAPQPIAAAQRSNKRKKQTSSLKDEADGSAASSSSKPKAQKQKTAASSAAAGAAAGSSSGAIAQPAALTPFVPHTTLGSFFPARSTSSCPCGLRRSSRKLVLGDGDLSYSVGLVRHLCSAEHAAYEARDDAAIEAATASNAAQQWSFDNCITDAAARAFYSASAIPRPSTSEQLADASSLTVSPSSLNLVCTTYESAAALTERYAHSAENAQMLRAWGIKVLHQVDARMLESYGQQLEPGITNAASEAVDAVASAASSDAASSSAAAFSAPRCSFHTVLFHFPHVGGKSRIHLNRALLSDFLASASKLLVRRGDPIRGAATSSETSVESRDGCIHVSLLRGQGGTPADPTARPRYADSWQVLEQSSRSSLVLAHVFPFHSALYTGYNSKGFRSRDEEFSERRGSGVTHVLVPAETAESQLASSGASTSSSSGDSAAIAPSIQAVISHPLCDEPFHPLTIVKDELVRFFSTRLSASPATAAGVAGLKPLPFDAPRTIVNLPSNAAAALEQSPRSSIVARVQFDAASLNTLQWNLEPLLAVANDMESQIQLPRALLLKQLSPPAVSASTAASSTSAESLAAVPLMREGLSLTHALVIEQRFEMTAADQTMADGASAPSSLSADMEQASRAAVAAVFGETAPVRCLPSSAEAGSTDVALQSLGVWHIIGRGNITATAWRLELSLDALALVRHRISDPRWLWSRDHRVRAQWKQLAASTRTRFVPFAMHTLVQVRDNSFWINPIPGSNGSAAAPVAAAAPRPPMDAATFKRLYTAAVMQFIGPALCCSLQVTDQFLHPTRGESIRFRLLYHSVDRPLSPDAVTRLQERLHEYVIRTTGVEMR